METSGEPLEKECICANHWHFLKEDYYGYKCEQCGLFIANGCEPWVLPEDVIVHPEGYKADGLYDED